MTYKELYEKVKPEMDAAKAPFKEYKKVRKTFTELFENKEINDLTVDNNT